MATKTIYQIEGKVFGVEVYDNGFAFTVDGKAHSVCEIREMLEGYEDLEGVVNDLYQCAREVALDRGFTETAQLTIRK